jgi:hypothetical protein
MKRFFIVNSGLFVFAAILSMLISACSPHQQIVLMKRDGSHQLVYNADIFYSQAKTYEDIGVLLDASWQIMGDDPQDIVTGTALRTAMLPPPDYKQLELVIYNYKVAQLKRHK